MKNISFKSFRSGLAVLVLTSLLLVPAYISLLVITCGQENTTTQSLGNGKCPDISAAIEVESASMKLPTLPKTQGQYK